MISKGKKKGDHNDWQWKTFGSKKREAWKF